MTASPHLIDNLAVCSWSLRPHDPDELLGMLRSLGLRRVQLALNPHRGSAGGVAVGRALAAAGVEIVSGMFGPVGEDYTTLESIRRTGGIVPDATWAENRALAIEVAAGAQALGLGLVSTHAGFLPDDPGDPGYGKLLGRLREMAGIFADAGVGLALETGQEHAGALLRFLDELAAPNVGVNFDPANMILYDKGDPVAALRTLLPYVRQVHIKDARRTREPGTWGSEVAVGTGEVDWPAFLGVLAGAGFTGALCIEREAGDDRLAEILAARRHLEAVLQQLTQS